MTNAVAVRDADVIRPGERAELKSLVRMRVRLLRAQIKERHAAQMAEIDGRVAAKFMDDSERISCLNTRLDRLVAEANRKAARIFSEFADVAADQREGVFTRPWYTRREDNRAKLRKAMVAAVMSQTESANLRVAKLESELLGELALNAIKSEAAKDFVRAIPEIGDLMPERLAAIEARFDAEATQ